MRIIGATFPFKSLGFGYGSLYVKESRFSGLKKRYTPLDIAKIEQISRDTSPDILNKLFWADIGRKIAGDGGTVVGAMLGGNRDNVTIHFTFTDNQELLIEFTNAEWQKFKIEKREGEMMLRTPNYVPAEMVRQKKLWKLVGILWVPLILLGLCFAYYKINGGW